MTKLPSFIPYVFLGTTFLSAIRIASGLLILKIVAYWGGASGIAIYGQAHSFASILNGVAGSAAGDGVVKLTAQNRDKPHVLAGINRSICIVVITSIIVISMAMNIYKKELGELLGIQNLGWSAQIMYITSMVLYASGLFAVSISNGNERFNEVITTNIVSIICASLLVVGVAWAFQSHIALLLPPLYFGLIGLAQTIILKENFKTRYKNQSPQITGGHSLEVGKLATMAVGSLIMTPITLITVRGWVIGDSGLQSAGDWESSRKICDLVTVVLTAYFSMVLLPQVSSLTTRSAQRRRLFTTALYVGMLSTSLLLLVYLFRQQIYSLIFTKDFEFTSSLLLSRSLGEVLKSIAWVLGFIMVIRGAVLAYFISGLFYMLVMLSTTNYFMKGFGIDGVNYAYIFSNIVSLIVSLLILNNLTIKPTNDDVGERIC